MGNNLEDLIRLAHALYEETSIFEVIDADRNAAVERMIEIYGPQDMDKTERHFSIFDRIREWEYTPE